MKELFNQLFRYMFLYLPATRILLLKLSTLLILLQVGKPKFHWVICASFAFIQRTGFWSPGLDEVWQGWWSYTLSRMTPLANR